MNKEFKIRFADRMNQLPPYLFGMINKIKMEKRWNGDDVIDLGMGNPVDPTPEQVTGKLCDVAIDPKSHRYPVAGGMKNLKREIALYYDRHYHVGLNGNDDVICTIGSKEGCALQAHEIQLPEMVTIVKLSQQQCTESCVVSGNGHCEA